MAMRSFADNTDRNWTIFATYRQSMRSISQWLPKPRVLHPYPEALCRPPSRIKPDALTSRRPGLWRGLPTNFGVPTAITDHAELKDAFVIGLSWLSFPCR